jgi:hypothetical protein
MVFGVMSHISAVTRAAVTSEMRRTNVEHNPNKDGKEALELILSDLRAEELEPRLELQVLVDPMSVISTARATNNNNNNNNKPKLV